MAEKRKIEDILRDIVKVIEEADKQGELLFLHEIADKLKIPRGRVRYLISLLALEQIVKIKVKWPFVVVLLEDGYKKRLEELIKKIKERHIDKLV